MIDNSPKLLFTLAIIALVLIAGSNRISARGGTDGFPQPEVRRSVDGVLT
jgi:hypothetical protein